MYNYTVSLNDDDTAQILILCPDGTMELREINGGAAYVMPVLYEIARQKEEGSLPNGAGLGKFLIAKIAAKGGYPFSVSHSEFVNWVKEWQQTQGG